MKKFLTSSRPCASSRSTRGLRITLRGIGGAHRIPACLAIPGAPDGLQMTVHALGGWRSFQPGCFLHFTAFASSVRRSHWATAAGPSVVRMWWSP